LVDAAHDWRWSSHRVVLGANAPEWLDVGRLLSYFGSDGGPALVRYRELIR